MKKGLQNVPKKSGAKNEKYNSFLSLVMLFILSAFILLNKDDPKTPEFITVFAIVALEFSFILIAYKLVSQLGVSIKKKYAFIVLSLFLVFSLIETLFSTQINSISFTLSLIIILFCIRYLLYNFYLWSWRKRKGKPLDKKWEASYATYFMMYFLLIPLGKYGYNVFLMFFVYAIYDFMKIKYLSTPTRKEGQTEYSINVFSEIIKIDFIAWVIVLFLFMLYDNNIFNIDKETLHYFYSTVSQVFAALLGIVVMFGILIIQKDEMSPNSIFLKRGLLGFSLIYVFVIMLSICGVLVSDEIIQGEGFDFTETYSAKDFRNIVNMSIFEISILMTPVALLYLYALVTDFLKLDEQEYSEYQKKLFDYDLL